jgi:general secretion pathway protein J
MNTTKAAGFTLLELLIAITLLGFILTLLFGGMRLGARSWDISERHADQGERLALTQNFLRRQLSEIRPYHWPKKLSAGLAFVGEPQRVQLVAPLAARSAPGGLYLIEVELVHEQGLGRLVMKRAFPLPDSGDFAALERAEKVVLAEQVQSVSFAYYGAPVGEEAPQWQDRWNSAGSRLPYLIRVRLTLSNGRAWPDLIVAPQVGIGTGCTWNNSLNRCVPG